MREVDKSGVRVDICPSCKGVWLDRGELEKLMDIAASSGPRSDVGPANPLSPGIRDKDHDDHEVRHGDGREHGGRRKRGSWLGDILGGFGGDD